MFDSMTNKMELLETINAVFDQFVQTEYQTACVKGCAVCCTQDVTATTLEAAAVLKSLRTAGRSDLIDRLPEAARGDLFRPRITTNTLAMACLTHQEPPLEEPPAAPGRCLLLENNMCQVYAARPFTCRGMFALTTCQPDVQAHAPEGLETLVAIGWQILEHLDVGGLYGNIIDLLLTLNDPQQGFRYESGQALVQRRLPPTRPVPGLLIPPEHQALAQRFLDHLFHTDCGGQTFHQRMEDVRRAPF